MAKRIIILFSIIIMIGSFNQVDAQYFENPKKSEPFKDKLFFGGGIGLQFGAVTQIEIAPIVGYRVSDRFQPGIGLTYSYFKDQTYSYTLEYSTYGGSVFARFFLFEGLFAQAEAEALNIKAYYSPTESERLWIGNYYVGGGYYQKLGERSGMYILVMWNLNQTELTPYSNPVIRIGFSF
jgi:hypothetical protein